MVSGRLGFSGSRSRPVPCYDVAMNAHEYTYRVRYSEDDQQFVGTCLEFPSLSHLADSAEAALQGVEELVCGVVAEMEDSATP